MSKKSQVTPLTSTFLNDIVNCTSEKSALDKLGTAIRSISGKGTSKLSSKSFCSFLNKLVKLSADPESTFELQSQYLELLGEILLCKSCNYVLEAEAAKVVAVFDKILTNWMSHSDSIHHVNNELIVRFCCNFAQAEQLWKERSGSNVIDTLKGSMVFARVLDAINKWTLHPNLHVSTFCALSQLCCALLKGKVGRMNINRMLDSSSDVCLSLGETQRKFPDFSVRLYLLQMLFRLSKNNSNANEKSASLLNSLDQDTKQFFETLKPQEFLIEASAFLRKDMLEPVHCSGINLQYNGKNFDSKEIDAFQNENYLHISIRNDHGDQHAKFWIHRSISRRFCLLQNDEPELLIETSNVGMRECCFLFPDEEYIGKDLKLKLQQCDENTIRQLKKFFPGSTAAEQPRKKTKRPNNLKVSVATVLVQDGSDVASEITSPSNSQHKDNSFIHNHKEGQQTSSGTNEDTGTGVQRKRPVKSQSALEGKHQNEEPQKHHDEGKHTSLTTNKTTDVIPKRPMKSQSVLEGRYQHVEPQKHIRDEQMKFEFENWGGEIDETSNTVANGSHTFKSEEAFATPRKRSRPEHQDRQKEKVLENTEADLGVSCKDGDTETGDPFAFDQSEAPSSVQKSRKKRNTSEMRDRISSKVSRKTTPNPATRGIATGQEPRDKRTSHTSKHVDQSSTGKRTSCFKTRFDNLTVPISGMKFAKTARTLETEFEDTNSSYRVCYNDSDDEINTLMEQVANMVSNLQKRRQGKKLSSRLSKIENSFKTNIASLIETMWKEEGATLPEEVTTVNNIREQAAGDIEELVQLTQRTRAFLDEHQGRLTTVAEEFEKLEESTYDATEKAKLGNSNYNHSLENKKNELLRQWKKQCEDIQENYSTTISGISSIVDMDWDK